MSKRPYCLRFLRSSWLIIVATICLKAVFCSANASDAILYSDPYEWVKNQNESDKQLNLTQFTNRFCSLSNLVQLAIELQGDQFRTAVSTNRVVDGKTVQHPEYKAFAATNAQSVHLGFRISTNRLSEDSFEAFTRRVRHYVRLRTDGMSTEYGLASLRTSMQGAAGPEPEDLRERIKRKHWVPDRWILSSNSDQRAVIVIDDRFALKFYEHAPTKRYDAKEFDPRLAPIIAGAQVEALRQYSLSGTNSRVFPYKELWAEARRTLRERHGVEWYSPDEFNPQPFFNIALTNRWWLTNR